MSFLVSKVLNRKEMFGKYYQLFKKCITLVSNGGYVGLQNIIRMVHPILTKDTWELKPPKQGNNNYPCERQKCDDICQ